MSGAGRRKPPPYIGALFLTGAPCAPHNAEKRRRESGGRRDLMVMDKKAQAGCESIDSIMRVFAHGKDETRCVEVDGERWWALADAIRALGIASNTTTVARCVAPGEVRRLGLPHPRSMGTVMVMLCVSDRGLEEVAAKYGGARSAAYRKRMLGAPSPWTFPRQQFDRLVELRGEACAAFDDMCAAMEALGGRLGELKALLDKIDGMAFRAAEDGDFPAGYPVKVLKVS